MGEFPVKFISMPCFIDYTIEHTKIMTEECTMIVKKLF